MKASLSPALFLLVALAASPALATENSAAGRTTADAMKFEYAADNIRDALDNEDRPIADRDRDLPEKTEAILRAAGLKRGMRVVDLRAGDGYLTHLLALAVYPQGKAWGNNDPAGLDEATAKAWEARLADPTTPDLARTKNPLGAPLQPYALGVDVVVSNGAYHDAVARGYDRSAMNAAIFRAVAVGGKYVVVDARAPKGSTLAVAAVQCRADEAEVRREVEAAGFRLLEASDALKDAGDSRSSSACGAAGRKADRFLLVFEKPKSE